MWITDVMGYEVLKCQQNSKLSEFGAFCMKSIELENPTPNGAPEFDK